MFQRFIDTGMTAPRLLGKTTTRVATKVVGAIKRDLPEALVNSVPLRERLAFGEVAHGSSSASFHYSVFGAKKILPVCQRQPGQARTRGRRLTSNDRADRGYSCGSLPRSTARASTTHRGRRRSCSRLLTTCKHLLKTDSGRPERAHPREFPPVDAGRSSARQSCCRCTPTAGIIAWRQPAMRWCRKRAASPRRSESNVRNLAPQSPCPTASRVWLLTLLDRVCSGAMWHGRVGRCRAPRRLM